MAEKFGHLLTLGHPVLIAERAGEVVGYAYASFYRPRAAYRFTCEDSIYLRPDCVGQGIGGPMLAELMAASAAAGFRQMLAVITAERDNSVKLHLRAGFREVGRYQAVGYKFDRWLDVVHLQRAL
jgi:phosphinothricin acetyltransferase